MCNMCSSTSEVMYTMYTRYTTFRNSTKNKLMMREMMIKNSHSLFVINSIYSSSNRVYILHNLYIQPVTDFLKLQISKVSTLLTSCIHELFPYVLEPQNGLLNPSVYLNFRCTQHTCRVHRVYKWCVDHGDIYIIWIFTISTHGGKIRRYQSVFEYGEDYEYIS